MVMLIEADPDFPDQLKSWALSAPVQDLSAGFFMTQLDLKTADNLYFQYQSGFLSEEAWQAFKFQLKQTLSQGPPLSFVRMSYEYEPMAFRASFRNLLDALILEIERESQGAEP